MKVAFILHGYPGLGKVMPGLILDGMFRTAKKENYQSLFFSSHNGYTYLNNIGYPSVLLSHDPSATRNYVYWSPFHDENHVLETEIAKFQPDIIIVDGEPMAIEVAVDCWKIPTVVLCNHSDLESNTNARFYRYYYGKATIVIPYGIDLLPEELFPSGANIKAVWPIHALVRPNIFQEHLQRKNPMNQSLQSVLNASTDSVENPNHWIRLIGVLGGGSHFFNRTLWNETLQIAENLLKASTPEETDSLSLFCADLGIYENLTRNRAVDIDLELISSPVDNTSFLLEADVVVGRLGINLLAEVLSLGCRALLVPIGVEDSHSMLQVAAQFFPMVQTISLHQNFTTFQSALRSLLHSKNSIPTWAPGNITLAKKIPDLLRICK